MTQSVAGGTIKECEFDSQHGTRLALLVYTSISNGLILLCKKTNGGFFLQPQERMGLFLTIKKLIPASFVCEPPGFISLKPCKSI